MSNRLFFNAREWSFNKDCTNNVGEKCFIDGIDGKLAEVYTIGNWQWDWTEIISKPMMLEKNTEYSFCFWLNGGENDRNCEVCQFRVVLDGDHANSLTYKLNRGYIKPLKRYKGWELYDLSFMTSDNDITQLKFVAQCAYMAVQPAKAPEEYAELEEVLDEFEDLRPQRHNLIFEDGWPANNWYSTKELRKKRETEAGLDRPRHGRGPGFPFESRRDFPRGSFDKSDTSNPSPIPEIFINQLHNSIMKEIDMDDIVEQLKDEIDMDDIVEQLKDEINIDNIIEDIKSNINVDSLREEVKNNILGHLD